MHRSATPDAPPDRSKSDCSVTEAAALLGRSPRWAWSRIRSGELPSALVGGRRVVKTSDVRAFGKKLRAAEAAARQVGIHLKGGSNTQGSGSGAGTGSGNDSSSGAGTGTGNGGAGTGSGR